MAHCVHIAEVLDVKDDAKFRNALNPVKALDNGRAVTVSGLVEGERDLWTVAVATAATAPADIWIVTTPELIYDESKTYTYADFYNGINDSDTEKTHMRITKYTKNDIFGLTIDGLSEEPTTTKKYIVPSAADGKGWTVGTSATNAYAVFIGKTVNDGLTYYSFEVL